MRFLVSALLLSLTIAGCRSTDSDGPGQVVAEWRGTHRGRFAAPMTAALCPESGTAELLAVRGDTGIGVALYPVDSAALTSGDYQVFASTVIEALRPGAGVAVRWFSGIDIIPFEGASGAIEVVVTDSMVSGSFTVRMMQPSGPDTLLLTGQFTRLPLSRLDPGCSRTSRRNIS